MRLRLLIVVVCMALVTGGLTAMAPVHSAPTQPSDWTVLAPGIEYQKFSVTDPVPNNIFVTRMQRSNTGVTLETSIGSGYMHDGVRESVGGMAARYDDAINYWGQSPAMPGWGTLNDVVVAINGSGFNMIVPDDDVPWGGTVYSGWYAVRHSNLGGGSGFGWDQFRQPFIGKCTYHRPEKQVLSEIISDTVTTISYINDVNVERNDNQLILYTPQYNVNTGTDNNGVEVLVEMTRPTMVLPEPARAEGTVREIYTGQGSMMIPFDHVVLSASGTAQAALAQLQVGDRVGISQEITSFEPDCATPLALSWTKTYASLGGEYYFLEDGEIISFTQQTALVRNPRTAIAYNDDYIFFVVVDGRDPWLSYGMTINELAIFSHDTLSATYGISEDGGGSSTMVINGEVVNNTLCNNAYQNTCKHVFLPAIVQPEGGASEVNAPMMRSIRASNPRVMNAVNARPQRQVANGIMMITVQPSQYSPSTELGEGVEVVATASANVRLGPGMNYSVAYGVNTGAEGVIVAHESGLNGIWAKGYYWWKVDFGGSVVGWVAEVNLAPAPTAFK